MANVGNFAYRTEGGLLTFDARHIARHHPARVLADVEAKRRIIDLYERCEPAPGEDPLTSRWGAAAEHVLRAMVTPFADHPECLWGSIRGHFRSGGAASAASGGAVSIGACPHLV